ncbi:OppA family ABC transporter substrate-binding lipoprotein [Mycoplasma zalophi]|uniref:Uncharacterized protein n=1 Tax=Mycoplasma zalophi TaxID=191287 RepID=A0ABS6DRC0_9MOLU|nr:hypothetical protein [Mycoplasma zalophi]MBU4691307.1 hypothetical protein [Mycoplasma zalophi]MBU4692487.1 hypothetical protein [Mycoplasma zalophi]
MKNLKKFKFLVSGIVLSAAVTVLSASVAAACAKQETVSTAQEKQVPDEAKNNYVKSLGFYKQELQSLSSETDKLVKQYNDKGKTGEENLASRLKTTLEKELTSVNSALTTYGTKNNLTVSEYNEALTKYKELSRKDDKTERETVEFKDLENKFTPLTEQETQKLSTLKAKADKSSEEQKEMEILESKVLYEDAKKLQEVLDNASSNYKKHVLTFNTLVRDINTTSTGGIVTAAQRKTYSYEYNTSNSLSGFDYDGSSAYGSEIQTSKFLQVSLKLLRTTPLNEPELSKTSDDNFKVVTKINKPSFWKYTFEGAKAVVVTLADGTVKVYDNDKIDDLNSQTDSQNSDGTYSSLYVQAFSNDSRSINSKEFLNSLNSIKKLQVVVRETPWVTSNGEKTKYTTKADDYYYSWMRTVLHSQKTRLANGSTQELEQEMNSLLPAGSTTFTKSDTYPNEYVYELYNVKSSDFYDRSKFITNVEGENEYKGQEALTFTPLDDTANILGTELFTSFSDSNDFIAAPSDYIKEKTADKTMEIVSYNETSANSLLQKIKQDTFLSTKVGQFGIFWYGMNPAENTLYAGPYYAEGFRSLKETYKQNPHFFNQEWVNSTESIKVIESIYQQAPVDAGIFDQRQWAKYREGTTTRIPYSSLNQQAKNTINENPVEYGLRSLQSLNRTNFISRLLLQPVPASFEQLEVPTTTNPAQYYSFNDVYAKLMWGSSLREIADGQVKSLDTFIAGTGLQFRTLISAAINWSKYIDALTSQVGKPYLAHLAPDASIAGKDQTSAKLKTVREAYEKVNSLFALNSDLAKIDFGTNVGNEITPANNYDTFKGTSEELAQYKSAGFEQIKAQMKKLLDELYKQNPDFGDQKVKFTYFYPYLNPSNAYLQSTRNAIEVVKALDSRIDTELQTPTNAQEFYRLMWGSGTDFNGWGYDLNTIGSGFDGFSWQGNLIPQLFAIGQSEDLQTKLQTSFPQMVDAAKALVTYANERLAQKKISFGKVDITKLPELLLKYQIQTSTVIDSEGAQTSSGTFSGQFWTNYILNKTNEDLIELAVELSNYLSPAQFDSNQSISSEDFAPFLLQKGYESPLQQSGIEHYADWKIKL